MQLGKISKVAVAGMATMLVALSAVALCAFKPATQAEAESVSPRLFTNISLGLSGGDGMVRATARNDFTLFPSTVYVRVELYRSYEVAYAYTEMQRVSVQTTADLNMGQSIVAELSTEGKSAYWLARTRYRADNADWSEKVTNVCLFDADGNLVQIM